MRVNLKQLKELLKAQYGIKTNTIKRLSGFYDANFKITANKKDYFVKIYGFDKIPAILFQIDLMKKANRAGLPVAKIIPTFATTDHGVLNKHFVVVQEFLPGIQLAEGKRTTALMEDVGKMLGIFHTFTSKQKFGKEAWKKYVWDLSQFELVVKDYPKVKKLIPEHLIPLIDLGIQKWKEAKPKLEKMRKGAIHNDYHARNILITGNKCTGITDFGDSMYSWYAADVGIALSHLCFFKGSKPEVLIDSFLKGYSKKFKLNALEKSLLPLLMVMRNVTILIEIPIQIPNNTHKMYIEITKNHSRALQYFLGKK